MDSCVVSPKRRVPSALLPFVPCRIPRDPTGARRPVTRSWSSVTSPPRRPPDLASSVGRLARLCAAEDAGVRYLHSAYLPADDTCFCLFTASSADAISAINDRAQFPLHRITAATILLAPPGTT